MLFRSAGDVGQVKPFGETGEQQSRQHGDTDGKQMFHKIDLNSFIIAVEWTGFPYQIGTIIAFFGWDATRESHKISDETGREIVLFYCIPFPLLL